MPRYLALAALLLALPAVAATSSGLLPANVDAQVRPQDDLFLHVNGGWLKRSDIPADKSSYGIDGLLDDRNQDWLKELVQQATSSGTPGSDARKIGDLYAAYMDEATLNQLGVQPLSPLLNRIGNTSKAEFAALFGELAINGVNTPVGAYVHPNAKDVSRYSLDLYQSGIGLPDRDFYLEKSARFSKLRAAYLSYATQLFTLANQPQPAAQARAAFAFELGLARSHWSKVQNRDPVKQYNPRTVAALQAEARGFNWQAWLGAQGLSASDVVVSQPSALQGFARQIAKAPLAQLRSYARLQLLSAYAPYLSQPFFDANFALTKALRGVQTAKPRWKRALSVVEDTLGQPLGKLYVAKHFPESSKTRVEALVANLLKSYAQQIDGLDWMSTATKAQAKEKLSKFTVKVGYPSQWRDYSGLQLQQGALVQNLMAASRFESAFNYAKLGQPVDKTEWQMTPQTINAYYDPQNNEIVFPAAILQAPYFDPEADDAMNYGAIGGVIGHEITHGFDDEGSQFDGNGNLKSWWTAEDRKNFNQRTQQLVKQFDGYEPVKGIHINGELTLGENIADLGGILMAWNAWQLTLNGQPAPVIDGYSGGERFFMGYTQTWMTKVREEAAATQLKSDPHSPPAYRVNGVVVNTDAFHQTYHTQPGDGLYKAPIARVKIW